MSDFCYYKEFLKELNYIKGEMIVWGIDFCIMQRVWSLKTKVKEFFPMNGVPEDIMKSLGLLEERMKIANDQLSITCERIILEVEKLKNQENSDQ